MSGRLFWGIVFVISGILLWLSKFGYFKFDLDRDWPIFVILLGVYLILKGLMNGEHSTVRVHSETSADEDDSESEQSEPDQDVKNRA